MKVALDTNVLAYAEGVNDATKRALALELMEKLPPESGVVPVQVLGELFHVLVRKAGRSREDARSAILAWTDAFPLIETSPAVLLAAMDLSADHRLGLWDAVVLSAAAEGEARLLLSEDLSEGFTWRGVTVANPFAQAQHPMLRALLGG